MRMSHTLYQGNIRPAKHFDSYITQDIKNSNSTVQSMSIVFFDMFDTNESYCMTRIHTCYTGLCLPFTWDVHINEFALLVLHLERTLT